MADSFALMTKRDHRAGCRRFETPPARPRDLADFVLRWSEFRPVAAATAGRKKLSVPEREVIRWLIRLADHVGDRELASG
jgi:hypothetical protein